VTLWTVGHGTASADEFGALLRGADLDALIDIRMTPASGRHPHFAKSALQRWLPSYRVDYRWEPCLGGRRRLPPDSPDVVWQNSSFRAYAAWTRTNEFLTALGAVVAQAESQPTAVMCSETLWWRCHRRLVADAVTLLHGVEVRHLMHDGRSPVHQPTDGVRIRDGGLLVYDAGQETL
jgi:uncharacterized protein (DUF488 family)